MNILFLHRNFPAQFRYIVLELIKDPNNNIVFLTNNEKAQIPGVKKVIYKLKREVPKNCHRYLKFYEESIIHGQAAAEAAIALRNSGFKPDIIYGHTWGPTMFMKDIFPDVPLLCYFEWFYNADGADIGFDGRTQNEDDRAKLRCKNSHLLVDLYVCDAGISPTLWQRDQFPKQFHNQIKVLHDGVDTDLCKPDENATFHIKEKNLTLSRKDEVITYVTRGMEPYRGFPQFMEAVAILQKKRPNTHFIIGGEDRVCYGPQLAKGSFKQIMLNKLDLDMDKIHFTGLLPFDEYIKVLQISSAHVYGTYPFVLSWSVMDAMAAGCSIIASDTPPVKEIMKDNYNALFYDFYNVEQMVEKIEFALDNPEKMIQLRENARKTIFDNYALKDLLPKHIEYIKQLAFTNQAVLR